MSASTGRVVRFAKPRNHPLPVTAWCYVCETSHRWGEDCVTLADYRQLARKEAPVR